MPTLTSGDAAASARPAPRARPAATSRRASRVPASARPAPPARTLSRPPGLRPPRQPTAAELREHVRAHAENRPGVYRMHGPSGELLYVGKSVKVRTRLLSYFRADRGEKAREIIGHAHRIEWEYVPSEFASLLLELRLIKRWRPLFNVQHRGRGAVCFIKLVPGPAPRLVVVNEAREDRALYFGPFAGRKRLRAALRELRDVLELRDCPPSTPLRFADQMELFRHELAPRCMRGDVGRCLAPCAGRCTSAEYTAAVASARRFLEGDADRPLAILQQRMEAAARRLQFEYAAELRDRALRLEAVRDELVALRATLERLSFAYRVAGHQGDDRLYLIRGGSIRAEVRAPRTPAERRALAPRAHRIFAAREPHPGSVPAAQIAEILLVARWFHLRPEELERTTPPEAFLTGS